MAKLLKEKLSTIINFLFKKALEDVFIFLGVALVLFTTYNTFGLTAGNYSLSAFLLLFGLIIAKK